MISNTATRFDVNYPLAVLETPKHRLGKSDSFIEEASSMTISHNSVIRGYNSIYQQATTIPRSDYPDFVGYCLAWHDCLDDHHNFEETLLFPTIERIIGEKGIMDGEIEQHAAFHGGLERFQAYLQSLEDPEHDFKPETLLQIMESFQEALYKHLLEEPEKLLSLARYSTPERPLDLQKIVVAAGMHPMTLGFALNKLPAFMLNMNLVEFEDGMWINAWPPVPNFVKFVLMKILPLWQQRRWRFSSCDGDHQRRFLKAA